MNRHPKPVPVFPGQLEYILVKRHEEYEGRGFVTAKGMLRLATQAKRLVEEGVLKPGTTGAVCSSELRALKSLQAFWLPLDFGFNPIEDESRKELFSNDAGCNVKAGLEVVREHSDLRSLVVFTHREMALDLAIEIGKALEINIPRPYLGYGQGILIDVLRRDAVFLDR